AVRKRVLSCRRTYRAEPSCRMLVDRRVWPGLLSPRVGSAPRARVSPLFSGRSRDSSTPLNCLDLKGGYKDIGYLRSDPALMSIREERDFQLLLRPSDP